MFFLIQGGHCVESNLAAEATQQASQALQLY
jgi:hypothetical protein